MTSTQFARYLPLLGQEVVVRLRDGARARGVLLHPVGGNLYLQHHVRDDTAGEKCFRMKKQFTTVALARVRAIEQL